MEIFKKINNWYKDLYLFGSKYGTLSALFLKKILIKLDIYTNMVFDLLTIAFNIVLIFIWLSIYSNKLYILLPLIMFNTHTIIVLFLVYKDRFSYIGKND